MSTSKNRPLIFIITVLLLTNIAVLGYFLWYKKPVKPDGGGKPPGGMEVALEKEVGFNKDQIAQYKQFKEEQWAALKPMFEDMRKIKDSLFRMISSDNPDDSVVNAVADGIAQKQKEMDLRMYNHFKRIRTLCTPEQRPKYDSVVQRMMRKMGKGRKDKEKDNKKEEK